MCVCLGGWGRDHRVSSSTCLLPSLPYLFGFSFAMFGVFLFSLWVLRRDENISLTCNFTCSVLFRLLLAHRLFCFIFQRSIPQLNATSVASRVAQQHAQHTHV